MTRKELENWCNEHVMMKSTTFDGCGSNYIRRFENGDTYEYRSEDKGFCKKLVTILINGEIARKSLWEDGWLPSGNWGSKIVEEY